MLIGILLLFFQIAAQERLLMFEHPADAGLAAIDLDPRCEISEARSPSTARKQKESLLG